MSPIPNPGVAPLKANWTAVIFGWNSEAFSRDPSTLVRIPVLGKSDQNKLARRPSSFVESVTGSYFPSCFASRSPPGQI